MLDKENRLKKRKAFNYIYRAGKCISTPSLNLIFVPNKLEKTKIGFSVSKKVGKAHTRNLIKRRLRASVRNNMQNIDNRLNYIFVAKSSICDLAYADIDKIVVYLIEKAKNYVNTNKV